MWQLIGAKHLVAWALTGVLVPFPADAPGDYQLGGAYDRPAAEVVARDRTEASAGVYDICYLNVHQTQPGELRWWKRHHPGLLLRRADGRLVRDPGWPDEVLLDAGTPAQRRGIARVVARWLRGCAEDGYEAAEGDNLDSFTRSRGLLSREDNLRLATRVARKAHRADLAYGQKNLAGLKRHRRLEVGFDFAVAEECGRWEECDDYAAAYDGAVLAVEYRRRDFDAACAAYGEQWSVVLRDRMLRPEGKDKHVYDEC